jgi:hypothetical protein
MGFLSAYSGTRKIPVGDPERGYWIEIKDCLSQGEKEKAEGALASGKLVPGQKAEMSMNVALYRQLMVQASIVQWNLDDDNGAIWPMDLKHVRMLPGPEFDRLWRIVDDLNEPAKGEEKQTFRPEGDGSDPDGDSGTAESGDLLA